jgi:replicative DNA helicase
MPLKSNSNLDVVPYLPKRLSSFPKKLNYTRYFRGEKSPTYGVLRQIATYAPEVQTLLEPEFYWDEVTSIEDGGIQHCYDLTVPGAQSFITNGIVSHNTSFLLSVTSQAAKYDARIAIFSMEMGADQIVQRLISMETGINSQRLRLGQLNQQEWNRFVQATGRMSNLRIFIDDSPALTPLQLRTKCRRIAHEHGLDLIIVDYLQLMNSGGNYENNRVQEISYISRGLKELARELNVPLFTAAQLSRAVEQRQDKRPQLSDLRESGSIEQDADIVMFLYRDAVYNDATEFPNAAEVIVAKHRNGPTGKVMLHFDGALTKFSDARTQSIDLSAL